jgi:hypothetical protein
VGEVMELGLLAIIGLFVIIGVGLWLQDRNK